MTDSPHARAQPATTQLRITLLGPPQLTVLGTPLPLPRRQLRALLYRLAVALQPVSREQLGFLLWPDLPDAAARRNLTVLLNQLRRILPLGLVRTQREGNLAWLDRAPAWLRALPRLCRGQRRQVCLPGSPDGPHRPQRR